MCRKIMFIKKYFTVVKVWEISEKGDFSAGKKIQFTILLIRVVCFIQIDFYIICIRLMIFTKKVSKIRNFIIYLAITCIISP